MKRIMTCVLATAAWTIVAHAPAAAQTADFSRKTINIYIGNTAGGSYDLYGRLVARYLGRFLPGTPNVIAENMPGAGTLKAANFIYSVAPKDGTALGIVSELLALEQALDNPAVKYDARKFNWIGRVASSNNIHMQWHTAKVQSVADALKTETPVAGTGPGNIAETVPKLLNAVIGTKFKVISGYAAANEAMLAMERGEVEGAVASWAAVKTGKKSWLDEKKVKIILQDVPERTADLPDVPALGELAEKPEDKQILNLYASGGSIGRAFMAPPGLKPEVTAALRDGFTKMTKDPEFKAEVARIGIDLEPESGAFVADAVQKTLDVPAPVLTRAKAIFGR
jgi:tripartite-type tricarboxylate transporter receptor subunit TctC